MANPSIEKAVAHAHAQRDEYMTHYHELLRIPSISTDPAHKEDINRCAAWLVDELKRIGFNNCQAIPSDGHPVVYGEWLEAGDDKPTVLVYAHYDVQPVDPIDLWDSPPFEPTVRDGKLYARGSIDDKAGVWVNLKAFESMFAVDGKLPVNIKILFEGEEETGSPNMLPFVQQHKDLLKADLLQISDGGSLPDQPLIIYGARGIVDAEVTVTGPVRDLHSGVYGGIVQNPVHVAGDIIASFHDASGRIQIDGFYDRVKPPSAAELKALEESLKIFLPDWEAESGVKTWWGEAMGTLGERATMLPTLDVNGIWGGYQGPGVKTIIPGQVKFKVTMRLVADQDPNEIKALFTAHVMRFASDTAQVEVHASPGSWPVTMLFDSPEVEAIHRAFEATWGKRALMVRTGGSIPIMGMFQRELNMPITSLGFGVGENLHSPNEFLWIEHFYRNIDTAIHFYYNLGEITK
ncbi:MAG: dipeptidase [Chloroflexi bacterium]|nr:MAG: dipeptidase [Chloroflexota bacterium]